MKLKKYIACTSLIGILSIGGFVISSAGDQYSLTEMQTKVISSYDNLIEEKGVEVVKVSYSDGGYLEHYVDSANGKEQVDSYNPDGTLLSRSLTTDFGKSFVTIGGDMQEDGTIKYSAHKTIAKDEVAQMNKELFNLSTIDSYLNIETEKLSNINWKQSRSSEKGIEKFTGQYGNVYINKENGNLTKREMVNSNGDVVQTIEVDVLNPKLRDSMQLFNLNSPYKDNETTNTVKNNFSDEVTETNWKTMPSEDDFTFNPNAKG